MDVATRLFAAGYATLAAGALTIPAFILAGHVARLLHWMDGEDLGPGLGIVVLLLLLGLLLFGGILLIAASSIELWRVTRRGESVRLWRLALVALSLSTAGTALWWIYHLSTT